MDDSSINAQKLNADEIKGNIYSVKVVLPVVQEELVQLPGDVEPLSDPAHLLHVHREHGKGVEAGAGQGGAELLDGGLLARVDQQQGEAAPGGPGRPAAPVDVGLRGAGDLVVDHVLDVGDVQAPGRHIRGHQEPVLASGEPVLPIYLAPPPVLAEAGHVLNCHFLHLGWRLLYHSCKV